MTARDALRLLAEERVLVLSVIALTIVGAIAGGQIMPPDATASAQVQVFDQSRSSDLLGLGDGALAPDHDVLMDTHVRLATSPAVATRVINRLGLAETTHTALERISVTALGRSTLISFEAVAPDTAAALERANTWVAEYVAWSSETAAADLSAATTALTPRITAAAARVTEVEARIKAGGHTKEIDTALAAATTDYEQLLARAAHLEMLASIDAPSVAVVSAAVAEEPSTVFAIAVDALKGLIAGAFLAMVLVLVRRRPAPAAQPN